MSHFLYSPRFILIRIGVICAIIWSQLSLIDIDLNAQPLRPYIKNFSYKDYGKDKNPETYCAAKDSNGVVYFGTAKGIITYNGSRWGFINLVNNQINYVMSLDIDRQGTIYLGGLGGFGYLELDSSGFLNYTSLSDSVQEMFGAVHKTYCGPESVYFQTEEALFILDKKSKKLSLSSPETSFHLGFPYKNGILIREREKGLMHVINGARALLPGSEAFLNMGLFGVVEYAEQEVSIILTQEQGLFSIQNNQISPIKLETELQNKLIGSKAYGIRKGLNNELIINTLEAGVLIFPVSFNGDSVQVSTNFIQYNKHAGLRVNDVKDVILDDFNNMWLATNNGISLINYGSPFSYFGEHSGIFGDVEAIANGGKLVGTSDGLFIWKNDRFEKTDLHAQVWDIAEIKGKTNGYIIATVNGIYRSVDLKTFTKVGNHTQMNSIHLINTTSLLVTGANGCFFYSANDLIKDKLKNLSRIELPLSRTTSIVHDQIKNEIWIGTVGSGVLRIFPDQNFRFDLYDDLDGLDLSWVNPLEINGQIYFGTALGLQTFISEEIMRESLPDSLKDNPEFARGYFDIATIDARTMDESINLQRTIGDFELLNMNDQLFLHPKQSQMADSLLFSDPFKSVEYGRLNTISNQGNNVLLGYSEGMITFEIDQLNAPDVPFKCFIDSIFLNGDSSISTQLNFDQIDYEFNTFFFQLAAPYYEAGQSVEFTHKLEGYDPDWSKYTKDAKFKYNDLKEGTYNILVKARNIHNKESSISSFSFTVLAPWYRRWYAYFGYALCLGLIIYLAIKLSLARLKAQNEELERIVAERTHEVVEQKEVIEDKHKEITASINYAQRIQRALMQADEQWGKISHDYFVLFKPRDVVSGDFYWAYQNQDIAIWVAADCTGHGVPGAFMSMLGIGFLNEIVIEGGDIEADSILNVLRTKIIKSLEQKGSEAQDQRKDGMDIALCVLDKKTNQMQFAGAYNPLYIIRKTDQVSEEILTNKEYRTISEDDWTLIELKASKMPVGKHLLDQQAFTKSNFKVQSDDRIYSFSDGFPDQFGGDSGKKYMSKRFKKTLLSLQGQKMSEQKTALNTEFANWMNEGKTEQIDDVCVVGVKII